jgi:hypothetical protein
LNKKSALRRDNIDDDNTQGLKIKNEFFITKNLYDKIIFFVEEYFSLASNYINGIIQRDLDKSPIYTYEELNAIFSKIKNDYNKEIDDIKNNLRILV